MKRIYEMPELEVVKYAVADVITTSDPSYREPTIGGNTSEDENWGPIV